MLIAAITRGGRATLAACRDSLADSAKSALTVGMACAIVGSIIGMMTQTGVGTIFGSWIIGLGAKSLFLALVMTMLLSILLGTGIPTIPTYIITAALAAPALAKLGVALIVSHMFAFYYGIMADLSPPVALAALAAAPIARENPDKIGWEAMRIALAGYVIPFIFVYSPSLMLQPGDPMAAQLGFYGAVAFATFKALVAIGLFGMVAIGFLLTRMTLARAGRGVPRRALPARRFPLQRYRRLRIDGALRALAVAAASTHRGGGGLSLCLTSLGVVKTLSVAAFTLAWTHSVEKIDWQEDWRITPQGLELVQARVKGSGAGMEPPPEARLIDGWFQWQPKRAPMPEVVLGNSGAAGEWRLCHDGSCRTLSEIFEHPIGANVTTHARLRTLTQETTIIKRREKSMERLKGKTAMVVGAGSIGPGWGNGKATAVTFARQGAQVFCVDRNGAAAEETVRIINGEGGKAAAFTADVSRAADVEAMVAACLKTYGRIDVLDNNVGIASMGSRGRGRGSRMGSRVRGQPQERVSGDEARHSGDGRSRAAARSSTSRRSPRSATSAFPMSPMPPPRRR